MEKAKIVVLCGSTRFRWLFEEAGVQETAAGNIVLTANIDFRNHWHQEILSECGYNPGEMKVKMDELHLRKIDMADEVLVLNIGNYIGESTAREVDYAWNRGKIIRWWETVP